MLSCSSVNERPFSAWHAWAATEFALADDCYTDEYTNDYADEYADADADANANVVKSNSLRSERSAAGRVISEMTGWCGPQTLSTLCREENKGSDRTIAISLGDLFLVLNVMGRRAEDLEIERGDMVDRWKWHEKGSWRLDKEEKDDSYMELIEALINFSQRMTINHQQQENENIKTSTIYHIFIADLMAITSIPVITDFPQPTTILFHPPTWGGFLLALRT